MSVIRVPGPVIRSQSLRSETRRVSALVEKQIKDCVYSALSRSGVNVFHTLNDLFKTHFEKSSTSMVELRRKTTKEKGLFFEIFCKMYLEMRGYDDVWLLNEVPGDVIKYLNMETYDVGIDLVARFKIPNKETNNTDDYFYVAVQSKYRKPTKDKFGREVHKLSWKELSTFLALVQRTGPTKYGWKTKIVMTNADSVSWRGKKKEYNVKTYAKKTFENIERIEWMKIVGKKEEGNVLGVKDENKEFECQINRLSYLEFSDEGRDSNTDDKSDEEKRVKIEFLSSDDESENEEQENKKLQSQICRNIEKNNKDKIKNVRELRMKWLDKLKL
jgi:hypothetical protein